MGTLVFVAVVAARFIVPLFIPRFPLPAIVVALVIDAADQTVFAWFDQEPANYQGYDKALDIFYLTIAYVSMIRNWADGYAFRVGQFLWYFRLAGVLAFEFSNVRALLIIFPNTFEYYFIAYEAIRLWYNPARMSHRSIITLAASIWIFVKLPQEYWIHIAQLDVTDVLGEYPWLIPIIGAALGGVAAVVWGRRWRLPPPDWTPSFDVDTHATTVVRTPVIRPGTAWAFLDHPLVEKVVLISLVSIIFSQILPESDSTAFGLAGGLAAVIVLNSFVSIWLVGRGATWTSTGSQFIAMAVVNVGIVVGVRILLRQGSTTAPTTNTLFFLGLLTLIATLYDRYRALRLPNSRLAPAVVDAVTEDSLAAGS